MSFYSNPTDILARLDENYITSVLKNKALLEGFLIIHATVCPPLSFIALFFFSLLVPSSALSSAHFTLSSLSNFLFLLILFFYFLYSIYFTYLFIQAVDKWKIQIKETVARESSKTEKPPKRSRTLTPTRPTKGTLKQSPRSKRPKPASKTP